MNAQNLKEGGWKGKFIRDLKSVAWISLYLVLFFCAISTYSMLMLHELNVTNSFFRYGFAIINALVLAQDHYDRRICAAWPTARRPAIDYFYPLESVPIRLACGSLSHSRRIG